MPRYRIRLMNSQFESGDEAQYVSLAAARRAAIASATSIVAESIADGELAAAVEVEIFEKGELVSRQVVNLSVAELITGNVHSLDQP